MPKPDLEKMIADNQPQKPVIVRGRGYGLSTNSDAGQEPTPPPQEVKPAGKVGRPKGPDRAKKTLYFYYPENIALVQKALFKSGDTLIKEESEIVDLALAVLAGLVSDASEVKRIIDVYNSQIKPASEKQK